MKPSGGGKPSGELLAQIEKDFGSFEAFVTEFKTAGATQFGSGWAWLVCEFLLISKSKPFGLKIIFRGCTLPLFTLITVFKFKDKRDYLGQ